MHLKRYLAVLLASCCILGSQPYNIYASALQETVQESRSEETQEEAITNRVAMVILAYIFEDGSIDVWQEGSGLIVDKESVIAPASLCSFTSSDDESYMKLAKEKKELYARVGVDTNDFDTVQSALTAYIVPGDGNFIKCTTKYTDSSMNLALLTSSETLDVSKASYSEEYHKGMRLAGFTTDDLSSAATSLTAGNSSCDRSDATIQKAKKKKIEDGILTSDEALDLGNVGGTIVTKDGEIAAMVTAIDESKATLVNGYQLKSFIESGPSDSAANVSRTDALDNLELAVERAKKISTEGYTEDSIEAFEQAISDAEGVLSDVNASLDEINTVGEALNTTKSELAEPVQERTSLVDKVMDFFGSDKGLMYSIAAGVLVILLGILVKVASSAKKPDDDEENDEPEEIEEKPKKKRSQKEKKETERKFKRSLFKKKEISDEGYGGEHARRLNDNDEDRGENTTVLSEDDARTTVLASKIPPAYLSTEDGKEIPITKKVFVIGKEKRKVSYYIENNSTVSRRHCMIKYKEGFTLEDLGSLNGTMVNNVPIEAHVPVDLSDGDTLTVSDVILIFHEGEV